MNRSAVRVVLAALVLAAALSPWARPLSAQTPPAAAARERAEPADELARLREAGRREAVGHLEGATAIVRDVLRDNPSSLTALLTYERLLAAQGRVADVLPAVDRLLGLDATSVIGHQVRLRVLNQGTDAAAIEAAVAAWIRATPHMETPYREGALVWRQRGELRRALAVLEQGRRRIDTPDALALELGDAHADAGDARRAAAEWARAVGPEGRGFLLVQRRLQSQADAGAGIIPHLVDALSRSPATPARRRAAALFAIDAGLEPHARGLADQLAASLSGREREQTLVEMARRADGAGLYRLAAWSYRELLRDEPDAAAGLAIRTRVAELALLAGDTALAADVYRQLEAASATGSPQRREAVALRLQLTTREGDLARAVAELAAFRDEFPHAPELDETAALLAVRFLDAGDDDRAAAVLAGVAGPQSSRLRGRLHIRAGDIDRARVELLHAAPLLQGRAATETIALAALLARVSPAGGELVARAVAAARDERAGIIHDAIETTRRLPAAERAAVLDFMAGLADASGLHEDADALRSHIVAALPASHEAAGALLALARRALQRADATDGEASDGSEARVLLEKLILEYPRSTLTPQARRELERLPGRGSRP